MGMPAPANPFSAPAARPAQRIRVLLRYGVAGDLRFLSHHDELRMLARALVRARWPVAFSQGFNPLPRLTIPLPRSVGVAADEQLALVDLRLPRSGEELAASLRATLPAGCPLREVGSPPAGGSPQPQSVVYELALDGGDAAVLGPRLAALLAAESLPISREYGPGKPARPFDLRPFVETIVLDGLVLRYRLRFTEQRTARPSEVNQALGLSAADYNHRLRRAQVAWNWPSAGPAERPAPQERIGIGKAEEEFRTFPDQETDAVQGRAH
jgi:radical SAM-linked protein